MKSLIIVGSSVGKGGKGGVITIDATLDEDEVLDKQGARCRNS